jgi:hypothetical protein
MRRFVLATLAIIALLATMAIHATDGNAVIYCTTVGVPRGCVVRPVVRAPVVVVPVTPTVVYCKTVGVPKGCVVR